MYIQEVIDFDFKLGLSCMIISIVLIVGYIFLFGPVGFAPKTVVTYVIGILSGVMVYSIIIDSKLKKLLKQAGNQ